ncbi:MAG: hypothetical protein ACYSSL_10500 [Planctomycetota bacterium]
MKIRPRTILLMILAGWVNRHQQDVIEYLKTENKILSEKLGRKRILLDDEQRKKLAVLGKRLGMHGNSFMVLMRDTMTNAAAWIQNIGWSRSMKQLIMA